MGLGIELGIDNGPVLLFDWAVCSGISATGVVTATVRPIRGSFVSLRLVVDSASFPSCLDSAPGSLPLKKVVLREEELVELAVALDNKIEVLASLLDDEELEDEEDSE